MKNNLVKTMLVMISAISVVAIAGIIVYFNLSSNKTEASDEISASEISDLSIDTEQITTNLEDKGFAKVSFRIQVDNGKAKKELEQRLFQVKNNIIYLLSGTKTEELQGQKGMEKLEGDLKKEINDYLEKGKVVRVFTTEKIVQ